MTHSTLLRDRPSESAQQSEKTSAAALTRSGARRLDSIDMLRGLVIVFMVLDHVRDFFHADAFVFDPSDPTKTTPLLFLTRWVTHLCAPTFVFLAGVSIFLQRANGKTGANLSKFLLTRGLWLIALELTIICFGFNFAMPYVFIQVIWAIGIGMVFMAALVRLAPALILVLGALIVAGHGMLGGIDATDLGSGAPFWRLAMEPGPAGFARGLVLYPAIPWFGIMCLGYGLGGIFLQEPVQRRRSVLMVGAGAVALFLVLRAVNSYGDPSLWTPQASNVATVLSFFNVSKYPPSLLYVLITLGVSLLLSLALEHLWAPAARVLLAFGRTPLATYVLHIYIVHALALAIAVGSGLPASLFIDFLGMNFLVGSSRLVAAGWGFNLAVVYVIWIAVLVALYPFSAWLARIKRQRRDWWLSYV
jgi:uncharacterized membrane protein